MYMSLDVFFDSIHAQRAIYKRNRDKNYTHLLEIAIYKMYFNTNHNLWKKNIFLCDKWQYITAPRMFVFL